MGNFETDRERAANDLAERLFFELKKQGDLCVPKTPSAFNQLKESPNVSAQCLHCSASSWPSWPRHSSRRAGLQQRTRRSDIS